MPWFSLGEGLIEKEFRVVEKALKSELDLLTKSKFEEKFYAVESKMRSTDFPKEIHNTSKKELSEKYSSTTYSTYKGFLDYSVKHIPLEEQLKLYETYAEQLNIYGTSSDVEYKPFALLKTVFENGTEKLYFNATNEYVFTSVSDDPYLILNLEQLNCSQRANDYFKDLTENKNLEGIVIKPNDAVYIKGLAPYRKVRNKKYLTIIYGYDYTHPYKYEKLIQQKSIGKELSLSIKEFEIGKKMLETPWENIAEGNSAYFNLAANMLIEEKKIKRD